MRQPERERVGHGLERAAAERGFEQHRRLDNAGAYTLEFALRVRGEFGRRAPPFGQARMCAERAQLRDFGGGEQRRGDAIEDRRDVRNSDLGSQDRNRFERLAQREFFGPQGKDYAEAMRILEKLLDLGGETIEGAERREVRDTFGNAEQFERITSSGCVDHGETIFRGRFACNQAQPLEHQKGFEARQRRGDVAEGAAFEHPARDRLERDDAVDEAFEFGARSERHHFEVVIEWFRACAVEFDTERTQR